MFLLLKLELQVKKMKAGKLLTVNLNGIYKGALNSGSRKRLIFVLQTSKHFFLDCPDGLYGNKCLQNCSMTCRDPGGCDMMTGHCNGGCQVGWTGVMCEKGYHLTINNTRENLYILKLKLIIYYIIISLVILNFDRRKKN